MTSRADIEARLLEVGQRIASANELIERQQRIVDELRAHSAGVAFAIQLLSYYEQALASHAADRQRLRAQFAEVEGQREQDLPDRSTPG